MIKREVRESLLAKLKITKQALSQRADRLKDKHGPMTTDEAVYIIAHLEGIDLSKHLSLEKLDRVRSMIPKEVTEKQKSKLRISTSSTTRRIKYAKIVYPLVKNTFIKKVNALGEGEFQKVFVLENSIRALIKLRLSSVNKDNWWPNLIPKPVLDNVERVIKKETKHPHRQKRGEEPLMYCNFDDLKKIIIDEDNYLHFQDVIIDPGWFRVKMEEVYMSRNNLAHSILLTKDDIASINLFYNQWARLMESAGIK